MAIQKSGSPFLYDESTGDVVGVKDMDGGETMLVTAQTDPVTGVIGLSAEGIKVKQPYIVEQSAVPASLTGTVAETTLASIAVPPMGPKDGLRITAMWSFTNSANLKTMFAKLNNATFAQTSTSTAGHTVARQEVTVMNRNATNSQLGTIFGAGFTAAVAGSFLNPSVETSGNNTVLLRAQLANTGETITLEGYIVELLRS